jgi:hypothetical protein
MLGEASAVCYHWFNTEMSAFSEDIWEIYRREVFGRPSTGVLFNQYRDTAAGLDLPRGASMRRQNLKNYLESFAGRPRVFIVGEAAGPWGCRFSGVPFTGERMLTEGSLPFGGRKTSCHEPPYSEASGTIFWRAMLPRFQDFLLWNSVPLHPHREGAPLSIRAPSKAETAAFSEALSMAVKAVDPERIIALGRKAEFALKSLGLRPLYVRHPSQSGARGFREGIARAMGRRRR